MVYHRNLIFGQLYIKLHKVCALQIMTQTVSFTVTATLCHFSKANQMSKQLYLHGLQHTGTI